MDKVILESLNIIIHTNTIIVPIIILYLYNV